MASKVEEGFKLVKSGINKALKIGGLKRKQEVDHVIRKNNLIGINSTNYNQRFLHPELKPTFAVEKNTKAAQYWGIPEKDGSFSVIPNPIKEFEWHKQNTTGGAQLFFNDFDQAAHQFNKQVFHPNEYKIVTPAKATISGNNINFTKPGELDFGSGQKKEIGATIYNLETKTSRPNYAADIFPRQKESIPSQPVVQKPSSPKPETKTEAKTPAQTSDNVSGETSIPSEESQYFTTDTINSEAQVISKEPSTKSAASTVTDASKTSGPTEIKPEQKVEQQPVDKQENTVNNTSAESSQSGESDNVSDETATFNDEQPQQTAGNATSGTSSSAGPDDVTKNGLGETHKMTDEEVAEIRRQTGDGEPEKKKTEQPRKQKAQETVQGQAETNTSGGEEESHQGGIRGFLNRFRSHENEYQKGNKAMIDALEKNAGATYAEDPSKLGRVDRAMQKRVHNEQNNLFNELRGAKDDEEFEKVLKNHNVDTMEDMSQDELQKNITDAFQKKLKDGPTLGDRMDAYHVHGIAATGVIGASVLGMADSRGQKSNSELYSDPFGQ